MTATLSPFISICIPSYKRAHYLERLLQSISEQSFRDFEVIISDDSDDDSVKLLMQKFEGKFVYRYYKNNKALGTPANWNFAIGKANGEWIKLMHDDDWFTLPTSLQAFADATKKGRKFIASGYSNVDDNMVALPKLKLTAARQTKLTKNPMLLFSDNYIGQPSVVMVHRSLKVKYDERVKWRVDIDYYMQLLSSEKTFTYIPEVLINLGIGSSQVTHSCLNVPGVELPEGRLLLEKYGDKLPKNILIYDAWWRIIRNTGIRNKDALYLYASSWPKWIENIVERQEKLSESRLQKGIYSKLFMLMNYVREMI